MSPCRLSHLISGARRCYRVRMEHPINKPIDAVQNDPSLPVTVLVVVLALIFTLYFTVRAAVPDLPLLVHQALADVPFASEQAATTLSMLR